MNGDYACTECDATYPSRLAAEDCADIDRFEGRQSRRPRKRTTAEYFGGRDE